MTATLIALAFLFVAGCSAFPSSEGGMACLKTCYFQHRYHGPPGDMGDSELSDMDLHSVFKREAASSEENETMCKWVIINSREFIESAQELSDKMKERATKCDFYPEDEAICKFAQCSLGALDEVKDQYPDAVVAVMGDELKIYLALLLKDRRSLGRPACSVLFEPYLFEEVDR